MADDDDDDDALSDKVQAFWAQCTSSHTSLVGSDMCIACTCVPVAHCCPLQSDFRARAFPLGRLRTLAKLDENVRHLGVDLPQVLTKVAEAFAYELTLRAWAVTKSSGRRVCISVCL
jgi:hypothetical protein